MRVIVQILGMALYPLVVHLLIMLEVPWLAVTGLVITSAIYLFLVVGFQRETGVHPGWVGLYLLLTLLGGVNLLTGTHFALFVPPVLINSGVSLVFAATLRAGKTPLVTQMMRFEYGGELPPLPLQGYARRLTWIWAVYFAAAALISLALAFTAPLVVWSFFTNFLHFLLVLVILMAQFLYRYARYRQYGVFMPWDTLRGMGRLPWPGRMAARPGERPSK